MSGTESQATTTGCGCESTDVTQKKQPAPHAAAGSNLENLIPIAVVIVGGCEPCAEQLVARALAQGSSWQDVDKTLRIVAYMQKVECFTKAVGPDVLARMEKPLAAGRKTLERAKACSCS